MKTTFIFLLTFMSLVGFAQNSVTLTPGGIKATSLGGSATNNVKAYSDGTLTVIGTVTHVVNIHGSAFTSYNGDVQPNFDGIRNHRNFDYGASSSNSMLTGLNLPNGAYITSVKIYYIDAGYNANSGNMTLSLIQLPVLGASLDANYIFTKLLPGGASTTPLLATVTPNHTVNNEDYFYYLNVSVGNGTTWDGAYLGIRGITITYKL